jgi:aspartate 1-decarboxylase
MGTYAIRGRRGSGDIILNGAVAHLGKPGDRLTIMSFTGIEETMAATWHPKVIALNESNQIVSERQ